jgi:hypothetical protein
MQKNYNLKRQIVVGITCGVVGAVALGILGKTTSHSDTPEAVKSTAVIPPMFKVDHRVGYTLLQGCFRRFTSNQPGTVGTISMPIATNNKWEVTFTDYGTHDKHQLDLKDIDDELITYVPETQDGLYQGNESLPTDTRHDEVLRCTLGLPKIPRQGNLDFNDFDGKFATVVTNKVSGLDSIDGPYDHTTTMNDYGPATWSLDHWVNTGRISLSSYQLLDPPYGPAGVR